MNLLSALSGVFINRLPLPHGVSVLNISDWDNWDILVTPQFFAFPIVLQNCLAFKWLPLMSFKTCFHFGF